MLLSISSGLYSADKSLKIAVVNIPLAIDSSNYVIKITEQLEKEFGPAETDLKSLQNEIIEMEKRYTKDSAIMGESEARRLVQQLKEKQERLQFESRELQRQVQVKQKELMAPLMNKVTEVLREIETEGNYDLILRSEGILAAKKELDITQEVTEKLNKKK